MEITITPQSTFCLVRDQLVLRGLNATVEHPGYVAVLSPSGRRIFQFGTANGCWAFDVAHTDPDEQAQIERLDLGGESSIPGDTTEVDRIAKWIEGCVATWDELYPADRRRTPRDQSWLETQAVAEQQFAELVDRIGLVARLGDMRQLFFCAYALGIERGAQIKTTGDQQ